MLFDQAALKPWLIRELDPISDSEPDVLADYVLVLLEKDQPDEELQRSCEESLASPGSGSLHLHRPSSPASR